MPTDIGLAAERVLRGCLDTNVASRWTIAMVDEDAWGIGWASHESSPASDLGSDCDPVSIPGRTRTNSIVISDSDSPPHSCSLMSEEPLHPGRRSGSSCSSSRSGSPSVLPRTPRYIPVSLSSLTDSILGSDTRTPTDLSTPTLLARGRPRTKGSPERADSRSFSPSVTPLTPSDLVDESTTHPRRLRAYGADSSPESEMGHTRGTSRSRWRGSELDDIEEMTTREKWMASRSRHSSRSRPRRDDGSHSVGRRAVDLLNKWEESPRGRSSRAGSQPSRSSSSANRERRLHDVDRSWVSWRTSSTMGDGVGEEVVVERMRFRSRSVGFDFGVEKARTRNLAPL